MRATTMTVATIVALLGSVSLASADTRYVSKGGTDNAGCGSTGATSCLTLNQAITNATTADPTGLIRLFINSNGGFQESITLPRSTEIVVLDGHTAIFAPPSGQDAITINGGPNDTFRFYNLYLAGGNNTAPNGIVFNSGRRLELHGSQIRGFGTLQLAFQPSGGTSAELLIENSDIAESGGNCILLKPNAIPASAFINRSRIHHCTGLGVRSDATAVGSGVFVRTAITSSTIYSVGTTAVSSLSTAGQGTARVSIEDTAVNNSATGVAANGPQSQILLNRATVSGHSLGLNATNGGTIFSFGNNVLTFNSNNGAAPTPSTLQ